MHCFHIANMNMAETRVVRIGMKTDADRLNSFSMFFRLLKITNNVYRYFRLKRNIKNYAKICWVLKSMMCHLF